MNSLESGMANFLMHQQASLKSMNSHFQIPTVVIGHSKIAQCYAFEAPVVDFPV